MLRIRRSATHQGNRLHSVSSAPRLLFSPDELPSFMLPRLSRLESQPEARQRYGGLLAVLRQQVEAYSRAPRLGKR